MTAEATLKRCRICGELQTEGHFALLPSGRRRNVCNHCRYVYSIRPSRQRRILREFERREHYYDF